MVNVYFNEYFILLFGNKFLVFYNINIDKDIYSYFIGKFDCIILFSGEKYIFFYFNMLENYLV